MIANMRDEIVEIDGFRYVPVSVAEHYNRSPGERAFIVRDSSNNIVQCYLGHPAVTWPEEDGPYFVKCKWGGDKVSAKWLVCEGETMEGPSFIITKDEVESGEIILISVKKGVVAE